MSGHSKWHKIQHKKGANDAKRSSIFTKLTRAITVAAQQGGGDPEMNFSLRLAIQKAKSANVPKDNIERAIKKGTGELKGEQLSEIVYEGYGPGGVAILIETLTDNTNRTVSEIKHIFSKHGGSLGGPGSVQWQFERKGVIRFVLDKKQNLDIGWDDLQLELMEAGAEDIAENDYGVEIICSVENFKNILDILNKHNLEPDDSSLEWIAKEKISLNEDESEKLNRLVEALEDLDDVREVYTTEK